MRKISATWPAPEFIQAFTTTRHGGISQGAYAGFNLAQHVGDDPRAVETNRQQLHDAANLPEQPLWLSQTHSTIVINLDQLSQKPDNPPQADAVYTSQAGKVCAVMTADCLPLLLCAPDYHEIAAVHAGWRGLCDGIIEQTLAQFRAPKEAIMAWLGPAIGPQKFEVGAEVRQQFMAQQPQAAAAFTLIDEQSQKYLADIYQLARQRLQTAGVTAIYGGEYCTVSQSADFYSYRRDGKTGRMASVIWMTT